MARGGGKKKSSTGQEAERGPKLSMFATMQEKPIRVNVHTALGQRPQ